GSTAKSHTSGINTINSQKYNSFPCFQFRQHFFADRPVPGHWHLIRTVPHRANCRVLRRIREFPVERMHHASQPRNFPAGAVPSSIAISEAVASGTVFARRSVDCRMLSAELSDRASQQSTRCIAGGHAAGSGIVESNVVSDAEPVSAAEMANR